MQLSELEELVFAYFLACHAATVNVDGRFRRREEFVQVLEDAFFYSTQKFGAPVAGRYPAVCQRLTTQMIDAGALLTAHDKWSGDSHQFDSSRYAALIRNLSSGNAICLHARQAGPQFWDDEFAGRAAARR